MHFTAIGIVLIIGILQGIVNVILVQSSSVRKQKQNQILSLILLCLSLTLLPTLFGQLGLVSRYPFLYFVPLDFSLFLFPILFFYFQAIFNQRISKRIFAYHFIVPGLFWGYFFIVWLSTIGESDKSSVVNQLLYFQVQTVAQTVWIGMVLFYSYWSLKILKLGKTKRLSKSQTGFIPWLRFLVSLLIVSSILEMAALAVGKYYDYWQGSPIDLWLGISFMMLVKMIYATIIYIIALLGFSKYRTLSYSIPNISSIEVDSYLERILRAMETDKKYLNPDLKLDDLASMLETSQVYVSSLLNKELNLSFNDFVNRYRVEEVKAKLETEALDKYTLLSLAKDSGFKSKTTFYRAFQKFTNQSPTDYIQNLSKS
ncbi:helix-turn-helix domain-containing protein [Ekhidna sp.]